MKKHILSAFALFFLVCTLHAQTTQDDFEKYRQKQQAAYLSYTQEMQEEYNHFRDSINAAFAEFMRKSWEEFHVLQGIPAPQPPEFEKPPVADPKKESAPVLLPFDKVTPLPTLLPRPEPFVIISQPAPTPSKPITPESPTFSFLFYNTNCVVDLDPALRFSLPDVSENSVAQAWKNLSDSRHNTLSISCLTLRNQLNLNDWGYLQMLKTLSEKFLGKESNEAVLLQMYILTQSGYKVRIARSTNNRLVLLIPSQDVIYQYSYLNINGVKYYIVNKGLKGQSFFICNHEFPKEQYFSWQMELPKLDVKLNPPKTFTLPLYSEYISIQTNQNLIDFYNDYPLTSEWNLYVHAGLSETVKQALYPVLQNAIVGKTEVQAAALLLDFCQMAFDYKTCAEQFGYERQFFPDENFFFPYNNCKHRATLYALLVKDLLNLEVVLLHYPGHLATAVYFSENVVGDFLTIDGKKFIVCDPTYIGARIGMAMDNCKQEKARVIRL